MKSLSEYLACYNEIDKIFETERAANFSNSARTAQIEQRQKINDQAYFVLCWGQLEVELNEACRNSIRRRYRLTDWTKRRGWDLYNPDDKRLSGLSFEERLSLVVDKLNTSRTEWKLTMQYYDLRNRIAHGGSHALRIDLNAVAKDFYLIQSVVVA